MRGHHLSLAVAFQHNPPSSSSYPPCPYTETKKPRARDPKWCGHHLVLFFFSSLLHFYQITEWFSLSLLHNSEKQSGSMMKKLSHVGILYSHISHYYYILETFQWWQAYTEEFKRPRFHLRSRSQSDATRHYVTNTHYSQGFCCCVAMFFSVSRNQTLCTHIGY